MKITIKGKQYGIVEFFRRWKEGLDNLTPRQRLQAKLQGIVGMILGIIFASFFILLGGAWYWIIFFMFFLWMQLVDLINTRAAYKQAKLMEDEILLGSVKFNEVIEEYRRD